MPFIPFRVDFNRLSDQEQATKILKKFKTLSETTGFVGAAITYSANHEQTLQIREAYEQGLAAAGISGGNQAKVIELVEKSLKEEGLEHWVRIIPITTCLEIGGIGKPTQKMLEDDLNYLESLLKNGWSVLGWQNQNTVKQDEYAIGGGISTQLDSAQKDFIQNTLRKLGETYPYILTLNGAEDKEEKIDANKKVTIRGWSWRTGLFSSPNITLSLNDYIDEMAVKDPKKYESIQDAIINKDLEAFKTALKKHRNRFSWGKTTGELILEQLLATQPAPEQKLER